jgi:hypothetical protein
MILERSNMINRSISAIPTSYLVIMTLVYTLLMAIFLELNNISGEENDSKVNYVVDGDYKSPILKLIDASCKSPCPLGAKMCIQICA